MKRGLTTSHILFIVLAFIFISAGSASFLPDNNGQKSPPAISSQQTSTVDDPSLVSDDGDNDKLTTSFNLAFEALTLLVAPVITASRITGKMSVKPTLTRAPPWHH